MNDTVCVVALDKNTNFIKTVTSCDKYAAQRYAQYYRSIGYNSRVLNYDELDNMINKEQQCINEMTQYS